MIPIREFRYEVAPDTPQCPGAMIDKAILNAAIEFCVYTLTWTKHLYPAKVREDVAEYQLMVPGCALIDSVKFAQHNDIEIRPTTEQWLNSNAESWRPATANQVTHFYLSERDMIRLYPIPTETAAKALDVVVVLKPERGAQELEDKLYNDHLEAIGHGALHRLKAMPGKPWTDVKTVKYHAEMFDKMKRDEKQARINDYTRGSKAAFMPVNYCGYGRRRTGWSENDA